jgi:hypothetical protein
MEDQQPFVNQWVDRAVREFDRNPLCAQLLRRLARESKSPFVDAALRHLGESCARSAALRLLSSLVAREELVFQRLSDPGEAARTCAINIFNHIFAVDPSFDVRTAKMLPDRDGDNHDIALTGQRGGRLIEVLDDRSDGQRLVPVLSHLVESEDHWLSTRAAIFIGKRIRSAPWAQRVLLGNNDAVRAHAVESIWGVDTPAARSLLHRYMQDESTRVAGNCLVGLHKIGEPGVDEEICSMAVALTPEFRATAAWAMGKVGGPVFIRQLTALAKDENRSVRGLALQSLLDIRRRELPEEPPAFVVEAVPDEPLEAFIEDEPKFELRLDGSSFAAGRARATWFGG